MGLTEHRLDKFFLAPPDRHASTPLGKTYET
jgi:hypothetical protein